MAGAELFRTVRNTAFVLIGFLVLASLGCDQDEGGNPPDDTSVLDTAGDTALDTDPGDVPTDTGTEDTGTGDSTDVPPDDTFVFPEPGTYTESLTVDGITRTYVIHVPVSAVASMPDGRVPFVIGLHGAGDTGSNFIAATRLTTTADTNGFIVAGPDGFNRGWFVQSSEGWPRSDGNDTSQENDTSFMLDLIDHAYESYGIDRNRTYVTGHSRGAGMTALLAITSGRVSTTHGLYVSPFAAYGVNAGYDPYNGALGYSTDPKRPVWIIHGTSDGVVPYSMGENLSNGLTGAGWDVTFTPVTGGGHTWLFNSQELWDYFEANPIP